MSIPMKSFVMNNKTVIASAIHQDSIQASLQACLSAVVLAMGDADLANRIGDHIKAGEPVLLKKAY